MSDDGNESTALADYPHLVKYSHQLKAAERTIVGRDTEIAQLMAAMSRPELCNALLLAPAGAGKSALVQATMEKDNARIYREVDVSGMISGLTNLEEMASLLTSFFSEAEEYATANEDRELVLFMDEFHQIVQLSPAAVEALKPILAASGTRGIRIIAATTYDEFKVHIAPNQPLVERLQRINLTPTDKVTTISILRGMAERYEVSNQFYNDHIFELIYDFTQRFVPASSQPRKSILVLDAMVGWHRFSKRPMDRALLADVLLESINVNVAFRVDAVKIKEQLDKKVFSQELATKSVARRLQLCVADLHDKTKPMSSFLFTGSTGVGKSELTKQLARLLFGDDQRRLIRFDMSEFADPSSLAGFKSELSARVWQMGHAVILFDEVEKADATVIRLLLQVLDDGRLTDDNGREVSFLNTYIVLTTNAGSEIYETIAQYEEDDKGSGEKLKEYMKQIRRSITETQGDNKFPPELLGRIDVIVPFQPLSRNTQRQIVTAKMRHMVQDVLTKHNVRVAIDPRVLEYLVEDKTDTDSNAGGARAAISKLTDELITEVAAFINANPRERSIVAFLDGDLVTGNKDKLKSTASIKVTATT